MLEVRKLWMTVLLLSISVIGIVAPMYAEGQASVADEGTTSTVTEMNSPDAAGGAGDFHLRVEPQAHTIKHLKNGKNRSATYSVKVTALSEFRGEVELSVTGLPPTCIAFFNPQKAIPKPVFSSVLKIVVPPTAPAGVYTLKIAGASSKTTRDATATLIVEGEPGITTTTTVQTTSVTTTPELTVTVAADQENYSPGQEVEISGHVRLDSGASAAGAAVSLEVLEPAGERIHVAVLQTDDNGHFIENFTLMSNAANGTYTIYVTASMSGYKDALATATFTVGLSGVPSVHIVEASVTLPNDTLSSEFRPGETVVVWTAVNNTGADLVGGSMWVEVLDPDNSPMTLVVVVVTIHTGEQVRVGVHVILASDAKTGIYTVRILVSDRPILAGGKFLDSEETAFLVTTETETTTTTTTTQLTSQTTQTSTTASETTTSQTTSETSSSTSGTA